MNGSTKLMVAMGLALLASTLPAGGTTVVLSDGNSTASIDVDAQVGMWDWSVNGTDMLYQQWFWYRVGSAGREASIDTIFTRFSQPTANLLVANYTGAGFTLTVNYLLTGGTGGNNFSDIAETIIIRNTGTSSLAMHFFQYSDFDLPPNFLLDRVAISPDNHVADQWNAAGLMLSETSAIRVPNHVEANTWPSTLASLNDGGPTTLNDVHTAGPGDATWAFQWDQPIGVNQSFIISKDKQIRDLIPEPLTMLGVLLGVGGIGGLARRRRLA